MGIPYKKKKRKKRDWEANHIAIRDTFLALYKENIRTGIMFPPSNRQIAEVTGLSENTVSKHFGELDLQSLTDNSSIKMLFEPIMLSMASAAMKGDHNCARLFIENIFGCVEKRLDVTTKGKQLPAPHGDTFQIIDPNWQGEVEELKKELQAGEK